MTDSSDYYEWRSKAVEKGLLHKAAVAYYINDSKQIYGIYIDDKPLPAPIFTYRDWIGNNDIEHPIKDYSNEKVSSYDEDNLQHIRDFIKYENGYSDEDVEDYFWNGDVYGATNCERSDINVSLVKSDYFTVREHSAQLEEELYSALYEGGFEPSATITEIAQNQNEIETPYRDEVAPDFKSVLEFRNAPRFVGANSLVIFNTGDGYKMPFIKRSDSVSNSSGWWSPPVAGVFQPYENKDEPKFKDHVFKEFAEVFFGQNPTDTTEKDLDPMRELDEEITNPDTKSTLEFTSAGIDCKNTNIQLYGLLVIDDPEYYQKYIKDFCVESLWEIEDSKLIDVTDTEELEKFFSPISEINPYHLMGLSEGLMEFDEQYDPDIGIELSSM